MCKGNTLLGLYRKRKIDQFRFSPFARYVQVCFLVYERSQKSGVYGSAVMKELILKVKCFSSNWLAASSHGLSGNSDAYKVAPAGTLDTVPKGGDTSSLQVFSRTASHGDLSYMGKAKCLVHRSHIESVHPDVDPKVQAWWQL